MTATVLTEWSVDGQGPRIPAAVARELPVAARVPGTIHTDLLTAGLIADPALDRNEAVLTWIGDTDWRYRTTFQWDGEGTRQLLEFDGLDTVAAVSLNGDVVLSSENMHRSHVVDVTGHVRTGENELEVQLSAPRPALAARAMTPGGLPHSNPHPFAALRKMACNFGWDWGPDVATAGIWRPARFVSTTAARLRDVRVAASVRDGRGTVSIRAQVEESEPAARLELQFSLGNVSRTVAVDAGGDIETAIMVPDPELWWPRGYGAQALSELALTLVADGVPVDAYARRVGFRRVELETPRDEAGTAMRLRVNGEVVFVRGANWIPDDLFPHRVDDARIRGRLTQAADAHINLVRVWGGGLFESNEFYDACDELGLLVWQDFLFACAAYPEHPEYAAEVEAEASEAIDRLSSHASLAVFAGGNEVAWAVGHWAPWAEMIDGRPWGEGYFTGMLPRLVSERAPGIAYLPNTPWSFGGDPHPNAPAHGAMHVWDIWNDRDYTAVSEYEPRFASEFGWAGPATWSTLRAAMGGATLAPESAGMLAHLKAEHGFEKLTAGLTPHFRIPTDDRGWHWAMSLNQALALRTMIEHFRALSPLCAGSIVWQLNDCWPVTSWSLVDSEGREKPAYFAVREAYADRLLTVQPSGDALSAVLVNDAPAPWLTFVRARRVSYDGETLAETMLDVTVPARGITRLLLDAAISSADDAANEPIRVDAGDARAHWFFAEPRDTTLGPPTSDLDAWPHPAGLEVRVTARTLLRELTLLADQVDPSARVDGGGRTLLPGETGVFVLSGVRLPDIEAIRRALRSANELVAGPATQRTAQTGSDGATWP